jgi:hypothetical protein
MRNWDFFAAFMDSIENAKDGLGLRPHQDAFFRGHSKSNFTLLPSLFRQDCKSADEYWKLERRTFFQFRALARELHGADRLDWDVLFHMQHHGLPTRLLDWTSVFGVALYFALLGHQEDVEPLPCIWILNPYAMNKATWNTYNLFDPKYLARDESKNRSYDFSELLLDVHPEGCGRIPWENPLAIYTTQRSERMFAQSGWFTIHGANVAPLEDIFKDRPNIVKKVDVPAEAIPAAKDFLTFAGIGHRQLFPGLDGLAKSVKERFGIAR